MRVSGQAVWQCVINAMHCTELIDALVLPLILAILCPGKSRRYNGFARGIIPDKANGSSKP